MYLPDHTKKLILEAVTDLLDEVYIEEDLVDTIQRRKLDYIQAELRQKNEELRKTLLELESCKNVIASGWVTSAGGSV